MSLSHVNRALVCAVVAVCVTLQGCGSSSPAVAENDVLAIQSDCGGYATNAVTPIKSAAAAKITEGCDRQSEVPGSVPKTHDPAKQFECTERPEAALEFTYNIQVGQLHNACLSALMTGITGDVTRAAALQSFTDNGGKEKVAKIQALMTEIADDPRVQGARVLAPGINAQVALGIPKAFAKAAANAVYITTTNHGPWDSLGGSIGGTSSASSASLGTSSDSDASDPSNSMGSSGSQASGSSGFYLQLWQWLLVAALLGACCGAAAMMGKKKAKKTKKKAAPAPTPQAPAPAPVSQPLLPPLMPLASTSTIMPSYSMVAAPATTNAFAAPAAYSYAGPASMSYAPQATTAYAAPATMSYAAPAAYAPQYASQQYASQQYASQQYASPQYASTYAGGTVI